MSFQLALCVGIWFVGLMVRTSPGAPAHPLLLNRVCMYNR